MQDFLSLREDSPARSKSDGSSAVDSGAQPLTAEDGKLLLAVNGEIYNHRTLRKNLKKQAVFKTHSDCEVIMYLVCSHIVSDAETMA